MKIRTSAFTFFLGLSFGAGSIALGAGTLGSARFPDVAKGSYYDSAVGELAELGVIRGNPDGTYRPGGLVTRAEVAVMLQRLRNEILGIEKQQPIESSQRTSGRTISATAEQDSEPVAASPSPSSTPMQRNPAGTFRFAIDRYDASEADGLANITVLRTGGKEGVVTVNFTLKDGTAVAGEDYILGNDILRFGEEETSQRFVVRFVDDALVEGDEELTITLSDPTGGAEIGVPAEAVLVIEDDDDDTAGAQTVSPPAGVLAFSALKYAVAEDGDEIAITVERTGGDDGTVSVQYASSDGTAIAFKDDYVATSGTLTLENGETRKSFTVQVLDDPHTEGKETITLRLSNPSGGAVLGATTEVVLEIADDEVLRYGEGELRFSDTKYDVKEEIGIALIPVERVKGGKGEVSVRVKSTSGTAKEDKDYRAVDTVLTFRSGEVLKTVPVEILIDEGNDPNEKFLLDLESPTGGAIVVGPDRAEITIVQ